MSVAAKLGLAGTLVRASLVSYLEGLQDAA